METWSNYICGLSGYLAPCSGIGLFGKCWCFIAHKRKPPIYWDILQLNPVLHVFKFNAFFLLPFWINKYFCCFLEWDWWHINVTNYFCLLFWLIEDTWDLMPKQFENFTPSFLLTIIVAANSIQFAWGMSVCWSEIIVPKHHLNRRAITGILSL